MSIFPSQRLRTKGFTVVELVVVVGIFAIVSGVVLVNHGKFGGNILITNAAYDIALAIRQSQNYGVSVREFTGGETSSFDFGYGVHLRKSNNKLITMFADVANDRVYNEKEGDTGTSCLPASECLQLLQLGRGNTIARFCATKTNGEEHCSHTNEITFLDITFRRPNPDALFVTDINADTVLGEDERAYQKASIVIVSPQGTYREIRVGGTGQISITPATNGN